MLFVALTVPSEGIGRPGREVLGLARRLADGGAPGPVVAGIAGPGAAQAAAEAVGLGADRVVAVTGRGETADRTLLLRDLLAAWERAGGNAGWVLVPGDDAGRELAPRLAFRLNAGVVTDAVQVAWEGGRLETRRPVYGGKAVAALALQGQVGVIQVKDRAFDAAEPDPARTGQAEEIPAEGGSPRMKVVEQVREEVEGIPMEEAPVVVAGGRGMGGPEPFQTELNELARILGGAVGASLAAVDAGWVPPSYQVGQTGKSVAPNLYVAVGISGASQHVAGIAGAKHVVAINKDAEAPIFRVAELGLVGDWKEVLPAFIQAVRELRG
ncbi:electron transfer flavoprotein subunit alpha/FixB family protein [Limnochorda pilosa]|uniref:Electron transfer flavoprotein subunit alpha n=1 Tax=Limnochorda pilosa TaxID=1555112 RepID=A0A0K2SG67_LIMPI|nr:electron transfer flavoprotein subunit alpha/FixB family protein [Limnochorda pilosa]BAS26085.1 electron transfer flavoprotein subunit alpha [Limnochorda pilosa]